ncbi:MAG TPA: DUF6599 family protein [Bacteroidota bacterium]|nr:DUF6599 family protein [Bacteroidota bacterium]
MRSIVMSVALLVVVSTGAAQSTGAQFPPLPGWKLAVDSAVYIPNNLWDVIDGAADLFLEYNFVDLHIGRYQHDGGIEIKVELYHHKTTNDAFGMYSQERYPDYHFLEIGTQGYSDKGVLNFLCGEFYVKISTVQSSKDAQDALMQIARAVEKQIGRPKGFPPLLAAFPSRGKEQNSEQYIAKNFLGYSAFNGAFTASYGGESRTKAFLMQMAVSDDAKKTLEAYLAGIPAENVAKNGNRISVKDPHNGTVLLELHGKTLCGIIGEQSIDTSVLDELVKNLDDKK